MIFLQAYGLGAIALAVGGMAALRIVYSLEWLVAWLIAVNAVALVFFGLDKMLGMIGGWGVRVPEVVLLGIVLGGGGGGGIAGMFFFRHKIGKLRFQIAFWLVVALQITAVIWFFFFR